MKNEWRKSLEETEGILKNLTRVIKGKGQETPLTKITILIIVVTRLDIV